MTETKEMKTLTINENTYEIVDANSRNRLSEVEDIVKDIQENGTGVGSTTEEGGIVFGDENNQAGNLAATFGEGSKATGYASLAAGTKQDASGAPEPDSEDWDDSYWRYNEAIGKGSMAAGMGTIAFSRASKSLGYRTQTGYPPSEEYISARPELISGKIDIGNPSDGTKAGESSYMITVSPTSLEFLGTYANCYVSYNIIPISSSGILSLKFSIESLNGPLEQNILRLTVHGDNGELSGIYLWAETYNNQSTYYIGEYDAVLSLPAGSKWIKIECLKYVEKVRLTNINAIVYPQENQGQAAVAIGADTAALGHQSLAGGYKTVAYGNSALAFGQNTKAIGIGAIALGSGTKAEASFSFACGENTQAIKSSTHAEGSETIAHNYASHAEGYGSQAYGYYSHAEGNHTIAKSNCQHTQGRYNLEDKNDTYAHIVGGGESGKPANIHTLDWSGNAWFAGELRIGGGADETGKGYDNANKVATEKYVNEKFDNIEVGGVGWAGSGQGAEVFNTLGNSATGDYSHAEGNGSQATKTGAHAEGCSRAEGTYSHTEGWFTHASGWSAHAEGMNRSDTTVSYKRLLDLGNYDSIITEEVILNKTSAIGAAAHAEGEGTRADGAGAHSEGGATYAYAINSHAEGHQTVSSGQYSHAEGRRSNSIGVDSHAEGYSTKAIGHQSHAEGESSEAGKDRAHAEGCMTKATGYDSHSEGRGTVALGDQQHVQGRWNLRDYSNNYAHIVGDGTGDSDSLRKNIHTLDWNGQGWYAGAVTTNGADYAEFFEWADGNPEAEDRIGFVVVLDGEKIRKATAEDTDILGIVSGTAAIIGDNSGDIWKKKYLTDEFGRIIYDMVEVFNTVIEPETGEKVEVSAGFRPQPRLNPEYNESMEYVSRSERPEWDTVGMFGKLYARDDGTCEINGYARIGADGVLTKAVEKTNMRVLSRVNEKVIHVLMK